MAVYWSVAVILLLAAAVIWLWLRLDEQRKQRAAAQAFLQEMPGGMCVCAPADGWTLYTVSPSLCRQFGCAGEAALRADANNNFAGLVHQMDRARVMENAAQQLQAQVDEVQLEFRVRTAQNEVRWMYACGRCVNGLLYFTLLDHTNAKDTQDRLRKQAERLQRLARKDALSGLYNRGATVAAIKNRLARRDTRKWCALLVIDLDAFKARNDQCGHPEGDRVIAAMGLFLRGIVREESDAAGRVGGDEFVVFFSELESRETACAVAQRIVNAAPHKTAAQGLPGVTVSVGLAATKDYHATFESLFACADKALYQAKMQGRSRCVLYTPT